MGVTEISSNEPLDYALVQCLRLFAQHGRKIRSHELIPENHVPEDKTTMGILKNVHDNGTVNHEVPHFRRVVE